MPNDRPRPASGGEDRSALPAGKRSAGPRYAWRPPAAAVGPRGGRRWLVAGLSLLATLCIAGLAFYLWHIWPTQGTTLVVVADELPPGNLALPTNLYGRRAAVDLQEWANSAGGRDRDWEVLAKRQASRDVPWPLTDGERNDREGVPEWLRLRGLQGRGAGAVVIYIAQPGAADESGQPFFFDNAGGRLTVKRIIDGLAELGTRPVLLILDATYSPTDWRRGVLENGFAKGVQSLEPQIAKNKNLLVIVTSSAGQRSWASDDLGGNVFCHFLRAGLAGGAVPGGEGPVYADKLFEFIAAAADNWVSTNRSEKFVEQRQQPLLLPREAREDGRAGRFLVCYGRPGMAQPPATAGPLNRTALETAWQECAALARTQPAPSVNSPRLWRRYRELLLRYEAMVRAGDTSAEAFRNGHIAQLADRIRAAQAPPAGAPKTVSLAMPAAVGVALEPAKRNALRAQVDRLPADTATLPAALKGLGDEAIVRLELVDELLAPLADGPTPLTPDGLTAIANRVRTLGPPLRPAEGHLAVMLDRYYAGRADRPDPELVRRSLAVRRLAERTALSADVPGAYPYCERLPADLWTKIHAADGDRRRGQDRLFAAKPAHGEAAAGLEKAEREYGAVRDQYAPLRKALAVRDEVFADLPFLTEWAAQSQPVEPKPAELESLWRSCHDLATRLAAFDPLNDGQMGDADRPLVAERRPTADALSLAELAGDVRKQFQSIKAAFERSVVEAIEKREATQSPVQHFEGLLVVPEPWPGSAAGRRAELVQKYRDMATRIHRDGKKEPGAQSREPSGYPEVRRLAEAMIGTAVSNHVRGRTDVGPQKEFCEHIHRVWSELTKALDGVDPKKPNALLIGERLALTGGTADRALDEPAMYARRLRWRQVFAELARRCELDHWYDEAGNRYYEDAALACYKAAHAGDDARVINELTQKLKERGDAARLAIAAPTPHTLTTERAWKSDFRLANLTSGFDPGYVTVGPKLAGVPKAGSVTLTGDTALQAVEAPRDGGWTIAVGLKTDGLESMGPADDLRVTLGGYYRGQRAEAAAPLPVRPIPDLEVIRPPRPDGTRIAVKADDGLELGAIALVLDCSGSMKFRLGDTTKFNQAKRELLRFVKDISKGTQVSLWAYGHRGELDTGCQKLMSLSLCTDTVKAEIESRIGELKADGATPLLDAMKQAADDLRAVRGPKTVLILSDGCHVTREEHKQPAGWRQIARDFRKEFIEGEDRGVSLRLVLFAAGKDDEDAADVQFADIANVKTASSKVYSKKADELYAALLRSVRPQYSLFRNRESGADLLRSAAADRPGEEFSWYPDSQVLLPKGEYVVRVLDQKKILNLSSGDRVALRVVKTPSGNRINRQVMADDPSSGVAPKNAPNDAFALGQLRSPEGSGDRLQMTCTLENRRSAANESEYTDLDRPRFTWWEMKPVAQPRLPTRSRVVEEYGERAPAWKLTCDAWPAPDGTRAEPTVSVWCSSEPPDAVDEIVVPAGGDASAGRATTADPVIESAGYESRSGEGAQAVARLVIRLSSRTGKLFRFVPTNEDSVREEQHRYFLYANTERNDPTVRYTAVFTLPAKAAQSDVRFKLVSVDAMKQKARGSGTTYAFPEPPRG